MAKTSNIYARIEPDVKEKAEQILRTLGIPTSNAINMFYNQIILQEGIPFDVKLPSKHKPIDMSQLSKEELNVEIQRGYNEMIAGKTKPAKQVFADIRRDYKI
jgi:DNA-damage-inducible protein J